MARKVHKRRKSHRRFNAWSLLWAVPAFLLFLCTGMLFSKPTLKYPITLTSMQLQTLYGQAKNFELADRIAFWSEQLMKNPKLLAPLGEGPQVDDSAPLIAQHFDCTTYVETVAALARSQSSQELGDQIVHIRYRDGQVGFETRNHFPEADWIPNNIATGLLRDVTIEVARDSGILASFAHKVINKVAWFKEQKTQYAQRALAQTSDVDEGVSVELPYIPIEKASQAIPQIPNGAVINIVRESRDSKPTLITHQGFAIRKGDTVYFRHAARNRAIMETPLSTYLAQIKGDPWKVVGFNVNTW